MIHTANTNMMMNHDETRHNNINGALQLPTIALVFNFSYPEGQAHNHNKMPLLSLNDVETLHHEWGHALHSLLSKTKFQHLSGKYCNSQQ